MLGFILAAADKHPTPSEAVMGHVQDATELDLFGLHIPIPDFLLYVGVTKHVVYMWLVAGFMIWFFGRMAKQASVREPKGMYNAVEALLMWLKADIVDQLIGKKDAPAWTPFFWTVFFIIWFNNILGLIPMGSTATAHLKVTGVYALMTFVLIHICAASHGFKGYFHAIVPSVPWWIWPLMFVVEMFGFMAKCMALAIRLFANMVAGHLLLLLVLSFILVFGAWLAIIILPIGIALYLLEIFVGTLHAYIFTFLSAMFIGGALHPDH